MVVMKKMPKLTCNGNVILRVECVGGLIGG